MIKLTEASIRELQRVLKDNESPDAGIRVGVRGSSDCGLNYYISIENNPLPEDVVLTAEGFNIYVDRQSAGMLEGIEIDFLDNPFNSSFILRRKSDLNDELPGLCRK